MTYPVPPPMPQGGNGVAPNGQPMPPGDFPGNVQGHDVGVPKGMILYEDGSVGPDPNATILPPAPDATPTTAAAAQMGFPQSEWSQRLAQRMSQGGIGNPLDFYNFVRNRGLTPPPTDPNAPVAPPVAPGPGRPIAVGPQGMDPAKLIPAPAPQGGPPPGQPMPAMPQQPPVMAPGQIPGGVPQNPQMPGFFPQGRSPR